MTKLHQEQVAELHAALSRQRREIAASVSDERAHPEERSFAAISGGVTDAGDEAVADVIADLGAARTDRHENDLRAIEAALLRLQEGGYGDCIDCGAAIGYARLKVSPAAARCVKCQNTFERTVAHPETPRL